MALKKNPQAIIYLTKPSGSVTAPSGSRSPIAKEPPFCDDKVRVEYIDGNTWLLLEDFGYTSAFKEVGKITVPEGFVTDFNSVPWFFWRVFPKTKYGAAAVVHDFLCKFGTTGVGEIDRKVSRKQADQVFEEFLKLLGASWWRRKTMYFGVRIGAAF